MVAAVRDGERRRRAAVKEVGTEAQLRRRWRRLHGDHGGVRWW